MHILEEVCYLATSFPVIYFFNNSVFLWECLWASARQKTWKVFISQNLLQPSIITSDLWLNREKLKSIFIWRKPGVYLFHRTSCNNFCLNAQKYMQRSRSFMVNQHSEITFFFSKNFKTQCGLIKLRWLW